jgi:hypothetical protein
MQDDAMSTSSLERLRELVRDLDTAIGAALSGYLRKEHIEDGLRDVIQAAHGTGGTIQVYFCNLPGEPLDLEKDPVRCVEASTAAPGFIFIPTPTGYTLLPLESIERLDFVRAGEDKANGR